MIENLQTEKITVAKINLLLFNGNGNRSSTGRKGAYSQSTLKKAYESVGGATEKSQTPEEKYLLAKQFTKGVANKKNFMDNSVGFWELKKATPKREPDYVSRNQKTKEKSSSYWYTEEGVYRKSNHWGNEVASSSWYIKGRKYSPKTRIEIGKEETAFIAWKDLKAKGHVGKHKKKGDYYISGFEFKK